MEPLTPGPREIHPWIPKVEIYLRKHDKAIVVPNRLIDFGFRKVIAHGNNFGMIEILDRRNVDFGVFTEIDIMEAISRGLINRKGDEIVWGGAVRCSISIKKLDD